MTQELTNPYEKFRSIQNKKSNTFIVKAKHIEGTQMCKIELPCKYKDKELTIVVYE